MSVQIKRATLNDLEQIEKIESSLEHRILSYATLSSTLDKDSYYYYVAIKDNIIVGYIALELLVDHFDLLAIAVLNNYRRQNIATMLFNEFTNLCHNINVLNIFLEVRQSNISAIKFYEKFGFEKIDTRKNYYTDTHEDAYIYLKKN